METFDAKQMLLIIGNKIIIDAEPLATEDNTAPANIATN
jgi:hypothetical protein